MSKLAGHRQNSFVSKSCCEEQGVVSYKGDVPGRAVTQDGIPRR